MGGNFGEQQTIYQNYRQDKNLLANFPHTSIG